MFYDTQPQQNQNAYCVLLQDICTKRLIRGSLKCLLNNIKFIYTIKKLSTPLSASHIELVHLLLSALPVLE